MHTTYESVRFVLVRQPGTTLKAYREVVLDETVMAGERGFSWTSGRATGTRCRTR
jgi:hypothetical protein